MRSQKFSFFYIMIMIRIIPDILSGGADTLYRLATDTLKEEVFSTVFNPDVRRSQFKLPCSHPLYHAVTCALEKTTLSRGRYFGDVYLMHSEAGCEQQEFHLDYKPDSGRNGKRQLSVLVALEDGTRLVLKSHTVELNAGDCCIFDSSVVHAGAAYAKENLRIFVYWPTNRDTHPENATYLERDIIK